MVRKVLDNFEIDKGVGLPLGNYTSQFFANVYLNELDYYIKHILKAKYYIRYVDDFVILHPNKKRLEYFMEHIKRFLPCLKIQLHPEKSSIVPLRNGINFLGYRVFFHHRLLRERNVKTFKKKLDVNLDLYKNNEITLDRLNCRIQGWLGHAKFANTFNLRNNILNKVKLVTT